MYRSSPLEYPKEKVFLFQTNEQEETISAQEVQGEEKEQEEEDKEVSTNPQEEVEDEYDTDSENEHPVEEDDEHDSLTFSFDYLGWVVKVATREASKSFAAFWILLNFFPFFFLLLVLSHK